MPLSLDQLHADRNVRAADWTVVSVRPLIERDGTLYELPRPAWVVSLRDTWDGERFKTLLLDGDTVVGTTRNGVEITLRGELGAPPDGSAWTPAQIFAALAELRTQLHVGPDGVKYRLWLDRDPGTGAGWYFSSCSTLRLETDVSNAAAVSYRVVVHAENPEMTAA